MPSSTPIRLGVSVPQARRDPGRRATGRHLHDRRVRRHPGAAGRGARCASRSCSGTATSSQAGRSARRHASPTSSRSPSRRRVTHWRPPRRACPAIVTGTPIRDTSRDRPRGGAAAPGHPDRRARAPRSSAARRRSVASTRRSPGADRAARRAGHRPPRDRRRRLCRRALSGSRGAARGRLRSRYRPFRSCATRCCRRSRSPTWSSDGPGRRRWPR